jgi:hypothetical protein
MANIPWLEALFGEYPVETKDGRAIRTRQQLLNLRHAYEHEDYGVMLDAVYRYMRVGHYFPKPADLWPHVQAAQEVARGDAPHDTDIYRYGRFTSRHAVTDRQLFEMEEARGWK